MKGRKLEDEARVVINNLQSNIPWRQRTAGLSAVAKKQDRQHQQHITPLEHLNILPGKTSR